MTEKILLVDDRGDKLLALESVFAGLGQHLHRATSGSDALRAVLVDDFAMILMDVHMPVMGGIETARLIRDRPRNRHTPIIFVTALGLDDRLAEQAYGLGAVDIVSSPVRAEVLRAKVSVFVELARLRRQAEERTRASEDQLALIVEQTGDGVIMADEHGVIRIFNRAAEIQHGITKQEISAPGWADAYGLFTVDQRKLPLEQTPLYRAVLGELVVDASWLVRIPSGDFRYLTGTATPLRRADGSSAGAVLITRDETAARASADALAHQARELQRSNEDLDRFASSAAHDLQEPLRMIAGHIGLLAKRLGEQLDERSRTSFTHIADGASRMQDLVRGMLAYARGAAGPADFAPVDLATVLTTTCDSLAHAIAEAEATVEAGPMPWVVGDRHLLGQLLQNLIENALKYRGAQPPRIAVTARREGAEWIVAVADNGAGIAPEHHERIFEPFMRLNRDRNGSGIGLATCRRIAERHGGRLRVESEIGVGSVFQVALPHADRPIP